MFERFIQIIRTDDPGLEEPAATRERLKGCFPPGAARRMTQLGMMLSATLGEVSPAEGDAIVYATQFAEERTLEAFLESFPAASPTAFQTSIHPGAVQQGMIRRGQPVGEFFPMAGGEYLPGQSLLTAMLSPAQRVVWCGGEERGGWLREVWAASQRTFIFSMLLTREAGTSPVGRLSMEATDEMAMKLDLGGWFDVLHGRKEFSGVIMPGWRVRLTWM